MNAGLVQPPRRRGKVMQRPCATLLRANGEILERFAGSDEQRGEALSNLLNLARTGDAIELGPGTFTFTAVQTLTSAQGITVRGSGQDVTILKRTTGAAGYVLSVHTLNLANLQVLTSYEAGDGDLSNNVTGGILVATSGALNLDRCHIKASFRGVTGGSTSVIKARDCLFTSRGTAIYSAFTVYGWNLQFALSCAGNSGIGQDVNVPTGVHLDHSTATGYFWACEASITATDVEVATVSGDVDQCGMFKAGSGAVLWANECLLNVAVGPAALLVTMPTAANITARLQNCWVNGAVAGSFGVYCCSIAGQTHVLQITGGSLSTTGSNSVAFRIGDDTGLVVSPVGCRFDPNSRTLGTGVTLTWTNPQAMLIARDLNTSAPTSAEGADHELASNSSDNKAYLGTAADTFAALN